MFGGFQAGAFQPAFQQAVTTPPTQLPLLSAFGGGTPFRDFRPPREERSLHNDEEEIEIAMTAIQILLSPP